MKEFTQRIADYSKSYPGMELLDENNFTQQMFSIAHPFMNQFKKDEFITLPADEDAKKSPEKLTEVRIHAETYFLPKDESRATIFMLHGFTGFTGKFYEVIYYFLKQHYSVVAIDFRGHGHSSRELDDGHDAKTYIQKFESYISDTLAIYEKLVKPNSNGKPIFLYAHSMGGAVATHLVELHPEYFAGVILSCPMFGVNSGSIPQPVVKALCKLMILKNGGTDYIAGAHDFDYKGEFTMKCGKSVSFNRYAYYNELRKVDTRYFSKYATYRWLSQAMRGGKNACKPKNAQKANLPILLIQCEFENVVTAKEHKLFAQNAPNIDVLLMKDCEHELFSSHNEYLGAYYYEIFSFYDKILQN